VIGAVVVAALAPTVEAVLAPATFERFAAVVILAVAAKTASARIDDWLPRPAIIVGLELVASVDPANARFVRALEPGLLMRAGVAGLVGALFAVAIAALDPWLCHAVDNDRFRLGSTVALGILPLGFLGLIPGDAPSALAVLCVTALLSFDPRRARQPEEEYRPDPVDVTAAFADGGASQGVAHDDLRSEHEAAVEDVEDESSRVRTAARSGCPGCDGEGLGPSGPGFRQWQTTASSRGEWSRPNAWLNLSRARRSWTPKRSRTRIANARTAARTSLRSATCQA